jgi:hypothetical protein
MALIIVLNNKEQDFLIGLLLLFITNGNLFFRFLNIRSLNHLVVSIEQVTTSVEIEMQHS